MAAAAALSTAVSAAAAMTAATVASICGAAAATKDLTNLLLKPDPPPELADRPADAWLPPQLPAPPPHRWTRGWWASMVSTLTAALDPYTSDWASQTSKQVSDGQHPACLVGQSHGSPFDRCVWAPQSPPRNICVPMLNADFIGRRSSKGRRSRADEGAAAEATAAAGNATKATEPVVLRQERLVCDMYSKGTGVCTVNVDWNQWSLMHCGVYPVPAVSRAQGHSVQLFCPGSVPLAVVPVLKSGSTAVAFWLMKMETFDTRKAIYQFQQHWEETGLVGLLMANQTKRSTEEIMSNYFLTQGRTDASFVRFLVLSEAMFNRVPEQDKRKLVVKTISRVISDKRGDLSRYTSALHLPPHLCATCCASGAGRLPVMFVRNPFTRLASNWRVFVLVPTEILEQATGNLTARQRALLRLRHFPRFVDHVARIVARGDMMGAMAAAAARAGFTAEAPSVQDWAPGLPFSLGDIMHFVRVSDLLASAPGDLVKRRGFLVHMERVDVDLQAAAAVLCVEWGHCLGLPHMTRVRRKESWLGMKWGTAARASRRKSATRLRWTRRARRRAAAAYAGDFALLGYSPRRPERRQPLRRPGGWLPGGGWWTMR